MPRNLLPLTTHTAVFLVQATQYLIWIFAQTQMAFWLCLVPLSWCPNLTQSHFVKKQVSSEDSFSHFPSVAPISPKENAKFSRHYQSITFHSFATSGSKTSQILWLLTSTRRVVFFFLILTKESFIDSNFHFNVAFYSLMFYTQFKVITSILFCQIS